MLKKAISVLLAISVSAAMFTAVPAYADAAAAAEWEFDSVNEVSQSGYSSTKWVHSEQSSGAGLDVEDGKMVYQITKDKSNTYLLSPNNLNIDGSKYQYVKIKLKNALPDKGEFRVGFCTTTETTKPKWSSDRAKCADTGYITANDTDYKEYVMDMSTVSAWMTGTITRLYIMANPYTPKYGGNIYIDYIKVVAREPVTHYVSSSAAAGGDGSVASPWDTLSDVSAAAAEGHILPGDTILLERGSVFNESLAPGVSGSSSNPITLSAYGSGARPVIAPGTNAPGRAAIMLDNVYGWKITQLEIKDARIGIEMRNRDLGSGVTPDGLRIEDCFIHDISGIAAPQRASDLKSDSDYVSGMEDEGVYMSYGILVYKELGKSNRSFNNVTVKRCYITETDMPLEITYANNTVVEECEFANSRRAGVTFSNVSDASSIVDNASHMSNCKVYNMGYDGGMYWGVAGVQFNTCQYFTLSDCDVFYTQIGGYDETEYPGKIPDGVAVDFEGADNYVSVKNCNLVGNMDPAFLCGQNPTWAADSPNTNITIEDNYIANNRLKTNKSSTRNAAFMHVSYSAQAESSGYVSGNTILKRKGQNLIWYAVGNKDNNKNYLTNDISYLSDNYHITIGTNSITETASTATVTASVAGSPASGETFAVALSLDTSISAASTELYVNADKYNTYTGLPESVDVTAVTGGIHTIMAKVTLTNGDVIYSKPIQVTVSGDIVMEYNENGTVWKFLDSTNGWVSNKGAKTGSKPLYNDNGTLEYYLSDDATDGANTNNFIQSPGNLCIYGERYKYVKIRLKSDLPIAGDIGVQFTTAEKTSFPGSWSSDTAQTVLKTGEVTANDDGFKEYIVDMSQVPAWTNGTITQLRLRINPFTVSAGNSGTVHIASVSVAKSDTASVLSDNVKYDWKFNISGNTSAWLIAANKGTLSQSEGSLVADIAAANAAVLCPVNLSFSGTEYPYIHFVSKNETGSLNYQKIQWITEDDATWNTTTMYLTKLWESADGYVHYIYDMSDYDTWSGKTITRFQIFPAANAASGKVYVDRIMISGIPSVLSEDAELDSTIDSITSYAEPFWENELMVNESVTMINGSDGSPAEAPLMYAPTSIVSVRNSKLDEVYTEGEDYVVEGNTIKLTENTSIKAYNYTDVYPETAITDSRKRVSGGYVYCPEGDFFHNGQLAVTYYHEKDADFPATDYQGERLPKLEAKLLANENVNVLLYGDSISAGANMSGKSGAEPWLPIYGELFCRALSANTGTNVSFTNISKAGQTSEWGAANANSLISGKNPDVLIIAFGMNDGTVGNTIGQFKTNIESIISTAKTLYPDCEIILVSTTIPNEDAYRADGTSHFIGNHRDQPEALKEIADEQGTAFVNMTAVHDKLLTVKRFVDMTGNYTNHPNDFLARCYVMSLMQAVNGEPGDIEWNFRNTVDGWTANKGTLTAGEHCVKHTVPAKTNSLFLISPNGLAINGSKYKYIKVRLKSELASSAIAVQFTIDSDGAFNPTDHSSFDPSKCSYTVLKNTGVAVDDAYMEYVIDMSGNSNWTSNIIQRFRLLLMPNNGKNAAGSMSIDWIRVSADESVTPVTAQKIEVYSASVIDNEDGETFNAGFITEAVDPSEYTWLKFKLGSGYKGIAIDDTSLKNISGDIILGVQLNNIAKEYKDSIGLVFTTEIPVD